MNWVEIGFKELLWRIKLKWVDGTLLFYKGWCDFVHYGKLRVGDICVFQRTGHPQKFEVCLFETKKVQKIRNTGLQQGKSMMKWLKMIKSNTLLTGEMVIPRLFLDKHEENLTENVHLLFPDGSEICVRYCPFSNLLYGLKKVWLKYAVLEYYILFFHYVWKGHFYVSIYNNSGFDVFDSLRNKILQSNVMS
ncbi:hypothetical protein POM88_034892 [Heracleum sosnowskyi]|uniref:TF-B3 domain-containing protein n=1 Tax=Heracleum sosnowskyi TaxID=360622 RepID=A0AAD8HMD8_9APIA|nr:hypothetical protein POM88_034892 [Heracleum sosnowskyi]